MKHNLLKSVIISVILLMGVSNAWGATNTTVYYAVPTTVVGSYTVKCNVNYKGDGDWWELHNMTKTDKTYDGYPIYSCTFTDKYDGLGCLQFQLYNGNNYVSQQQPIGSWTSVGTYNGKLLKHDQSGWNTYRYDQHGFEAANNGIKYYSNLNANDEEWNFNGQSAQTKELGEVTSLYLKEWFVQLYENWAGAQGNIKFQYNIHPTANSAGNYTEITKKWEVSGNWNNGWLYPKYGNNEQNINLLNGLLGSGKYTMSFKYYDSDLKLTSPVHKLNWTYNIVPSVNNFKVTASNVVSGTGTSGDPYVIACGKTTTLTVSGNKASTDANSSLHAKFANNTYSSTLTKNLTPNSTKQSVQVKAKYYNSKDDLSGTEKSTTIYYRAQTFAVNITSSGNGTVNLSGTQQVGATQVSITATPNLGYAFKQWDVTGGAKVANATNASTTLTATAAGTVKAIFEEKPATTIYLEPTGFWNSHNAKFVAHVWNASGADDITMKVAGEGTDKYYTCEVPYGYTDVVFYRVDPSNTSTIWNQTNNLEIPTDKNTLYEIKSTGDRTTTKAIGDWKAANLVYTITLNFCDFGTYGIKYNGQSFFSKPNDNVTIDLPAGAEIEVLAGQPYNEAYTGDVYISSPTVKDVVAGEKITITGNITFEDNFVTKESHVVYLGVPNTLAAWNVKENNIWYYIWRFTTKGNIKMVEELDRGELAFEDAINGFKYYKFTISAGCNKIMFQHKQAAATVTRESSISLLYGIPLTEVNCFTLDGNEKDGYFTGSWNVLPAQQGDHRLLYIEQKVELENGHPNTIVTKAHPSDIIRQGDTLDTYSLHIYNKVVDGENGMNDPEILVQECTGYDGVNPIWTTRERHMVFGPLHADFGMAAMPGRRDAAGDPDAVLRNDNGIENIKKDINTTDPRFVDDQASGVWNFIVTRDGSNDFAGLDLKQTARYTGDYYVRTDCADGGWDMYTAGDNHMHFSAVSKAHSNYSHYFCKWVGEANVNVKYTIANDYGIAISDTLTADKTTLWGQALEDGQKMVTNETLPAEANVRFSWNEKTNGLHRAYLAGSSHTGNRFLILSGKSSDYVRDEDDEVLEDGGTTGDRAYIDANEEIFADVSNWVYFADVHMRPKAEVKITADYASKVQYFIGKPTEYCDTILQGDANDQTRYLLRLLYDFKTNELISAYVPGGQVGGTIGAIETNLMLIRVENNEPKQLAFSTNNMKEAGKQAYGVLELTKATLEDNNKNVYVRSLYWVSFPFDVRATDIFGFGEYGKHWIIQSYNGAKRAANGLFLDSDTNWEYHFDPQTINTNPNNTYEVEPGVLKAGLGYVIALDLDQIKADNIFTGNIKALALYFPSKTTITGHIVNTAGVTVEIPEHQCNINRPTPKGDRRVKDSHWNVIGVPSYINAVGDFSGKISAITEDVKFYYSWLGDHDKYEVVNGKTGVEFRSLNAYMVQFAGEMEWTNVLNETPAAIAAKRNSDNQMEHELRLELQQNSTELDRTFITLQEDDVTTAFDFNYDLCKIKNKGANIYSLIATDRDPIEVAGNVMPVANTTIPLGVVIAAAGEYTFAMPEGTDGIVVELIDYQANTTTNLLFNDYTVSLPKGTFENRFALSVKPDKTATSLENIFNEATGDEVKKFIIDGVLYMQKDGVLYDAQGRCVQ